MSSKNLIKGKEADVLKAVLRWLEINGIWHWREQNAPAMFNAGRGELGFKGNGTPGKPDILGILPPLKGDTCGRPLMIECKKPGWTPPKMPPDYDTKVVNLTAAQQHWVRQAYWLARCKQHGGVAFVATSTLDCVKHLSDYIRE